LRAIVISLFVVEAARSAEDRRLFDTERLDGGSGRSTILSCGHEREREIEAGSPAD
jgi:hypothetical protein